MDAIKTQEIKELDEQMARGLPLFFRSAETLRVDELDNPDHGRTLLYGYTLERDSFHVYLKDKLIHVVIYDFDNRIIYSVAGFEIPVGGMVPTKRAYPAACDEQFCRLMIEKKQPISYTIYEDRQECDYHGELAEDLESPIA